MSGAEAIAVLGVLSSIVSLVDGTKSVFDAATDAQGLPEAFREVADRLPIVLNILDAARRYIGGRIDTGSYTGVKSVADRCEKKAKMLDEIFQRVIPAEGAPRAERYLLAFRIVSKRKRVETLMKGILEDIQLLAINRDINTMTDSQRKDVAKAIEEISALPPSIPEEAIQGSNFTNVNSGAGHQTNFNSLGGQYNYSGKGNMYNSSSMSFTSNAQIMRPKVFANTLNMQGPEEDNAKACMKALFLTNPSDDREKLKSEKGSRVDGTCEWIKTNRLYELWLHSNSQLLWLSGGPGKGKTMLSIFLAEELERAVNSSQILFLQYFCDNKDADHNTAITIIRGLIFQLLNLRPTLSTHILPSFQIQGESLFNASSSETLWRILCTMLLDPDLGPIYCILDGLDECDEASLEWLLKKLRDLFSIQLGRSSAYQFKLIVLSRELPDFIPYILSGFPRIQLDPDADTEVNHDIYRFIEFKVDELSRYRRYSELLSTHVEKVFQSRAQGTFLWVGIVAQSLMRYKATEVEDALDLFPPGLNDIYGRLLLQIDQNRREIACRILRWVVMALRPLSLSELGAAIETQIKDSSMLSRDEMIKDQVSYCGHFLTIKGDKIGLIHQSAKDYLIRKFCDPNPILEFFRINEYAANLEIARKCFHYLQKGTLRDNTVCYLNTEVLKNEQLVQRDDAHLEAFPLLPYAALYWFFHTRSLSSLEDIFDLSLPFYRKTSGDRESWLKIYWAVAVEDAPPDLFTPLHLASYFNILPLAENILDRTGRQGKVPVLSE